ncbi:DUF5817 domain-containing protein [Haloarchaeobius sp. FL176]|uniref:DUF5817 domain-containing protein n=1 Tax=Haloarchaeobius sp. FL176 TaxID=2967129 RepID=UPI002148C8E8|nr:DUF5817 domain-containing protein [Haloarchaeobius sp. FL176]
MYHVVGCSDCGALRIVEGRPETTRCGTCGTRTQFSKVKSFVETDDLDHAREVRASMLANRQGEGEAFAAMDSFAELEADVADGVLDDDAFLEASGLDVDRVNEAGDRATETRSSTSRKETVKNALRDLDGPTAEEVVAYADERGVPGDYVERALTKLVRQGEVSESRGQYRLL